MTLKTLFNIAFSAFIIVVVSSCSHGRYQQRFDSIPSRLPTEAELQDAVPKIEKHSRGGNKDYRVLGKDYQVLSTAKNFSATGKASWYGEKFHGHLTSNGEIYNMYSMTAAHKNLPLPTYLKVTNLLNNKSVIVRVNDRGPFHQDRIIDLSYSAAYKLDMLKTGTANVHIEAVAFNKAGLPLLDAQPKTVQQSIPESKSKNQETFIQAFATKNIKLAQSTANVLSALYQQSSHYQKAGDIYRIHIGPLNDPDDVERILMNLQSNGYPNAFTHFL